MRKQIARTRFTVTAPQLRGQGRPRFRIIGGRAQTYKAAEDRAWEQAIRSAYFNSATGKDMAGFADEVEVCILTLRSLPKSTPNRVTSEPDLHKPDADNIAKAVLDALNRVAFRDDSQVVRLVVEKLPRTRRDDEAMAVEITYYANLVER